MDRAHTKGPLAVHHQSTPCTISGFYHVTEVGKERPAVAYVHSRDDALFYAAAPDMYEALKTFVAEYVDFVESGDAGFWDPEKEAKVIAARAAIAKAEGLSNRTDATPNSSPAQEG